MTGVPISLGYATVGVVVARHRPGNPLGWILIFFVLLFLIAVDAGYYAVLRYRLGHDVPFGPVAVVVASLLVLAFALFPLMILLFPDGKLTSRRWRWALWGYAGLVFYVAAISVAPPLPWMPVTTSTSTSPAKSQIPNHLTGWLTHPPGLLTAADLPLHRGHLAVVRRPPGTELAPGQR